MLKRPSCCHLSKAYEDVLRMTRGRKSERAWIGRRNLRRRKEGNGEREREENEESERENVLSQDNSFPLDLGEF